MTTEQLKPASLHEAFPHEEARAIAKKLEFHCTPKDVNWLNIAEIKLAVFSNSCLSKHIPDPAILQREVNANVGERNDKANHFKWRFSTQDARRKIARLYPCVSA